MTDTQIIDKFISKAKGYPLGSIFFPEVVLNNNYYKIIFNLEYAKAFFGEERVCPNCGMLWGMPTHCCDYQESLNLHPKINLILSTPIWIFHLKRMVTLEEPLKYLEKFLED